MKINSILRLTAILIVAVLFIGTSKAVHGLDYKECERFFRLEMGYLGKDVVWVPTPDDVVTEMLRMANVNSEDIVYDLGAGDGKIVIASVKDFGAKRAVGIEYDPEVVKLANCYVTAAGVDKKVKIIEGDFFKVDYSEATVITLVVLEELNLRLRPTILNMQPGTRVVSYLFSMGEWEADKTITMSGRPVYLWIVPAKVEGRWVISEQMGKERFTVVLKQKFQKVSGYAVKKNKKIHLQDVMLKGNEIDFSLKDNDGIQYILKGFVKGNEMKGILWLPNAKEIKVTGVRKRSFLPIF